MGMWLEIWSSRLRTLKSAVWATNKHALIISCQLPAGFLVLFLFYSFPRLRWVGDGREHEHDSLLRPHSLPGAPHLSNHTGNQKIYNRLKRCSGNILQQTFSLPYRGFFSVEFMTILIVFVVIIFAWFIFFNLQKLLFCFRHWFFSVSLKRSE